MKSADLSCLFNVKEIYWFEIYVKFVRVVLCLIDKARVLMSSFVFFRIISKKMFCKSQLFAAAGLVGVGLVSSLIQPHLEVFNRWIHVKKQYGQDMKSPDRVNRLAKSV